MSQVIRSRALWAAVGSITLAVVLLITLAPARDVTHTVLGWLRVTPLEIDETAGLATAAGQTVPATPTPTLAEVVEVVSSEPGLTIQDPAPADIRALPFEVLTISPSEDFSGEPERSISTLGTLTLQLNTADLAALLSGGFGSRSLARRLGTDELTISGGAVVVTTWPADDTERGSLTLFQVEAPLVRGLPPRDLELLAELLAQAFVPPILSQEIDLLEIPLVQLALGLEGDASSNTAEPALTDLTAGNPTVAWMHERSQLLLTGPLPPGSLLRLAETARTER
ncbi:MAG: hypothetical protein OXG65_07390 [Chloroflexi bacterium]|nr:hypothetical protein [Chloroflexota bacterium]